MQTEDNTFFNIISNLIKFQETFFHGNQAIRNIVENSQSSLFDLFSFGSIK